VIDVAALDQVDDVAVHAGPQQVGAEHENPGAGRILT
jgi:hypothetical protein